jgi:hypothetical protein
MNFGFCFARRPLSKTATASASGPPPAIDRHFQPDFIRRCGCSRPVLAGVMAFLIGMRGSHLDTGRLATDLVRQEQDWVASPAQQGCFRRFCCARRVFRLRNTPIAPYFVAHPLAKGLRNRTAAES